MLEVLTDEKVKRCYEVPSSYFTASCFKLSGLHIVPSKINEGCLTIQVDKDLLSSYEHCNLYLICFVLSHIQESDTDQGVLFKALMYYVQRITKSVSPEDFEHTGSTIGVVVGALCAMFTSSLIFSAMSVQVLLALSSTFLLGITLGAATLGIFGGAILGALLGFGIAVAINYVNVVQPEERLISVLSENNINFSICHASNPAFFTKTKVSPTSKEDIVFSPSLFRRTV